MTTEFYALDPRDPNAGCTTRFASVAEYEAAGGDVADFRVVPSAHWLTPAEQQELMSDTGAKRVLCYRRSRADAQRTAAILSLRDRRPHGFQLRSQLDGSGYYAGPLPWAVWRQEGCA